MKNKKGFTLIEILAAIIILGVVLLIGVSAISDYIESSRKSSLIATANSYIEEVRGLRATDSLVQSPKNAEALLIPLSEIEIDGNNDLKTPYGNIILEKSYVIVENENEDFNYYISILDDTNHAIVFEDSNLLNNNSITTSKTEIEKMKQITAIKQNLEYIELNDKLYYVSSKNIENSSTVLLDCDALVSFTVEINEDWENDNKTITVNMVKEVEGYQYYISERSLKPLKSDSNWQDDNKFVKDRGTYYVFIKNETGEISSGKKVIVDKIDRGIPTCTLKATGEMSTEEYFGTDVIISFASYQDVNTDDLQVSGIKDYGIGSSTGNRFVVQTEDSVDGITYTGYIEDRAGNIGTCSITVKRKAEFVLTYNNNGGSGCTTKAVIYNNAIGDLCIPTRSGYSFMGWYSNESLTNSINSSTIFKNEYVDIYAKWKANNYKVTFNANGGSVGTSNITVTYDSAYGTLPNPTRSGYTFKGWYTDVAEGTLISNTTIVSTAKDHTLYARWTPNIYTLTYNNNGGAGCTNKQVTYNSDYGTLCTPTRTGYTFLGWYTSATGGTQISQSTIMNKTHNHTIYARWKANNYTLTYNNNGGTGCTSKTVTYNSSYGTLCTPTRTGYTFLGWYTAVSGGTQITQSTTMTSTQNHTVYAQWKINTYTLAYNNNGGTGCTSKTVTYNSSYGTLCTPIRTGYTFLGWYTSATGGTQISQSTIMNKTHNHTIYARWKANNYTLTYNNNGGTGCTSKTVTYNSSYGTLCTPTRTGYTFLGWYTAASGGTQITQSTTVTSTQNHTVYAQWKINTYTITYNLSGGSATNPTSYTYETNSFTLSSPLRAGYTFLGWTGSNGVAISKTVTIYKGSTGNRTYTANWKMTCSNTPVYTYTGSHQLINDGNGNWRIKFLSSGTFKLTKPLCSNSIDVFLVGGGAGGFNGGNENNFEAGGSGGGGGYTRTSKYIQTAVNTPYQIVVGLGGGVASNGGASSGFGFVASGGYASSSGGNGGSGGGAGGAWNGNPGGSNGSSSNGLGQKVQAGPYGETGNTCEFGEYPCSTDKLYSGGGGGGAGGQSYIAGNYGARGASGGAGGGGKGGDSDSWSTGGWNSQPGGAGTANTGGGGGGGGSSANGIESGGVGGSGIVIIRNSR